MTYTLIEFIKRIFGKIFKKKSAHPKRASEKTYGYLNFTFKKGYGLSSWAEKKAIGKYNKLLHLFIQKNKRHPNKSEVGRIINASHTTIKYRRGRSGHRGRQKVRHYLFNLHGISFKKK